MAVSDAHKRASARWNSSRDNIMIRPNYRGGRGNPGRSPAGGKSVQAYILDAIRESMSKAPTTD